MVRSKCGGETGFPQNGPAFPSLPHVDRPNANVAAENWEREFKRREFFHNTRRVDLYLRATPINLFPVLWVSNLRHLVSFTFLFASIN